MIYLCIAVPDASSAAELQVTNPGPGGRAGHIAARMAAGRLGSFKKWLLQDVIECEIHPGDQEEFLEGWPEI